MIPTSVVAVFCQDIRDEVGGLHTLVGIMPDNIEVSFRSDKSDEHPVMPRLAVYMRLHFDPEAEMSDLKCEIIFPTGEARQVDTFNRETVEKARSQSIAQGSPVVGVISRVEMSNFPVHANGRLKVIVTIKGVEYLAGAISLQIARTSSTEQQPPS